MKLYIEAPVSTPKSTTRKIQFQQQHCLSSWNSVFPMVAVIDKNSFLFLRFLQDHDTWWPFSNSGLGHDKQTSVNCMAWRPASAATIALGTANGILIWRFSVVNGNIQFAKHLPCTSAFTSGHDNVSCLTWSPDGKWLVAGLKDLSGLVLWDVSLGVYEYLGSFSSIESMGWFRKTTLKCVWSDDGDYLLQIMVDGGFRIW